MPRITPRNPNRAVTAYTSRNMYTDLLDRIRVLAAVDQTTMEDTLNYLVEKGLEAEARERSGQAS